MRIFIQVFPKLYEAGNVANQDLNGEEPKINSAKLPLVGIELGTSLCLLSCLAD